MYEFVAVGGVALGAAGVIAWRKVKAMLRQWVQEEVDTILQNRDQNS